ncbi:hypothetical protein GEV33_004848 [Tenebrio molitor]|uniref:Uncharacterized protein n=1 Tax=Tenebrio molitor TaxID=7067 RepID=A0A8J6LG06_TENMO|nr:hypothetical protein GEV33_004848 [Tenebrio molitor]
MPKSQTPKSVALLPPTLPRNAIQTQKTPHTTELGYELRKLIMDETRRGIALEESTLASSFRLVNGALVQCRSSTSSTQFMCWRAAKAENKHSPNEKTPRRIAFGESISGRGHNLWRQRFRARPDRRTCSRKHGVKFNTARFSAQVPPGGGVKYVPRGRPNFQDGPTFQQVDIKQRCACHLPCTRGETASTTNTSSAEGMTTSDRAHHLNTSSRSGGHAESDFSPVARPRSTRAGSVRIHVSGDETYTYPGANAKTQI